MKRIIKLTESDLTRIVRRVMNENALTGCDREWGALSKSLEATALIMDKASLCKNAAKLNAMLTLVDAAPDSELYKCLTGKVTQWCGGTSALPQVPTPTDTTTPPAPTPTTESYRRRGYRRY
jgi:hypothetical protein